MSTFISYAVILLVILLIVTILIQVRGPGSSIFGAGGSTFRTRRGVEKTLFQLTIVLGIAFTVLAFINARYG